MGTRGFKTIRYRGRYYCFYSRFDSYPEGLGKQIQNEIPTTPEAYAEWLFEQREKYEAIHKQLEDYLSVRCYNAGEYPCENGRSAARPQLDTRPLNMFEIIKLPSYIPEDISEYDALWDYVVDLDREVFTINNSAHMKLNHIPKHGWIRALIKAARHDYILLPGLVPKDSVTDLVLKTEAIPVEVLDLYDSLGVTIDNRISIAAIPFSYRHGSRLAALVFEVFQRTQRESLENLLLGWNADDFCFREIVFAILCIASPARNLSLIRSRRVLDSPEAGYSDIVSRDLPVISRKRRYDSDDSYNTGDSQDDGESDSGVEDPCEDPATKENDDDGLNNSTRRGPSDFQDADPEFVAHLGIGCHLQENQPGSSAKESIYWFEGALIVLAVQLTRMDVVAESVTRVFQYHQQYCAHTTVNAIIISIEHVILMTIDPHGTVRHTKPLCLFALDTHQSKDASARYPAIYLDALENYARNASAMEKAMNRRQNAEMAKVVKNRKHMQTWSKAIFNSLEGGVDAVYKPERGLERIHFNEQQEMWNSNPKIKKTLAVTHKEAIYEFQQVIPDDDETKESFLALTSFLEVAARQQIPTTQGRLPVELYRMIIAYLPDTETYRTCMGVSILFRDLCQQDLRVIDNLVIFANGLPAKKQDLDLDEAQNDDSDVFKTLHLLNGIGREVEFCNARNRFHRIQGCSNAEQFKVVVGSQRDRRTILTDMEVCLRPVAKDEPSETCSALDVPLGDDNDDKDTISFDDIL